MDIRTYGRIWMLSHFAYKGRHIGMKELIKIAHSLERRITR